MSVSPSARAGAVRSESNARRLVAARARFRVSLRLMGSDIDSYNTPVWQGSEAVWSCPAVANSGDLHERIGIQGSAKAPRINRIESNSCQLKQPRVRRSQN